MNSKVGKCQRLFFSQKMDRVVFPWRFNLFISTSSQSVKQRYRRLFNHICDMKSLFCRLKKYSYIEYSWFANIWNNLETIFYCSLQNKKFYALLSPTYECANPELFQNRKLPARRGFKNGRPIMWVFSRQLIYRDNKCYIGTPSFTVCVDEYNQWKGTSATIASQASKKKMAKQPILSTLSCMGMVVK